MGAQAAIAALTAGADPRTWSLIVTIFGDMARAEGAEISGPVLSAIMGRIGVRPEAMRVALHRLRKDGWIETRREGRVSHYRLTQQGRDETKRASARIYAPAPPAPKRWHVLVAGPLEATERLTLEAARLAEGYVALGQGVWLGMGAASEPSGMFVLEGAAPEVPEWLQAQLMPEALAASTAAFNRALAMAEAALDGTDLHALPMLDRAVLRMLIVHGWRRLVLRQTDLPDRFFPADWQGAEARARVQGLLARLGQPALEAISESGAD